MKWSGWASNCCPTARCNKNVGQHVFFPLLFFLSLILVSFTEQWLRLFFLPPATAGLQRERALLCAQCSPLRCDVGTRWPLDGVQSRFFNNHQQRLLSNFKLFNSLQLLIQVALLDWNEIHLWPSADLTPAYQRLLKYLSIKQLKENKTKPDYWKLYLAHWWLHFDC